MKRAEGKVVVITGGNSGIGKGIALKFAREGASVVILGRNKKTLAEAEKEIGGKILSVQGDVTKIEDQKRLFDEAEKRFGKVDVVVANSGVVRHLHIEEASMEDYDYVYNTNNRGLFLTVKCALPHMNDGGAILLIASVAAYATAMGTSIYSSGKAAVVKLAENLSYDLADRMIRVNSISPGYIKTPIFDPRLEEEPDFLAKRAKRIPLKRVGMPEDIANAALFLASDEAAYITGTDLLVDGGLASSFVLPE